MKGQQQVPPGIVAFKSDHRDGLFLFKKQSASYEDYVNEQFERGRTIHTISVEDKEYSVGDEFNWFGSPTNKIESFQYKGGGKWMANNAFFVAYISKLPPSSLDRSVSQPGKPFIHSGGEMNKSYYDKQSQPSQPEYDYGQMDEQQYRELTYDERREHDAKVKASQPVQGNALSHYVGILTDPPLTEQGNIDRPSKYIQNCLKTYVEMIEEKNFQIRHVIFEQKKLESEIQDRDKRLGEMAEALDRIANPLKWMQKDLKEGYALNGQMAVELSNNPAHLKNIAEIALKFYEEYKKPKQ